jgi:hypothetical protein
MAEPAAFSVQVKLETMDMYRFSLTTVFRRFRWFMVLMLVVAMGLIVSLTSQYSHWEWNWQNILGPLFVFVFMPYAFFVAPYFSSRKYLRKNPNLSGPFTYTFSEGGIDVSGPNSQGHLNWQGVMEVRETSAQFLLYPQTAMAHVIPKRFLAAPDQQSALRALVRSHVRKCKLRS